MIYAREWRVLERAICAVARGVPVGSAGAFTFTPGPERDEHGKCILGTDTGAAAELEVHVGGASAPDEVWLTVMRRSAEPGRKVVFDGQVTKLALECDVLPWGIGEWPEGMRAVATFLRRAGFPVVQAQNADGEEVPAGLEVIVDRPDLGLAQAARLLELLRGEGLELHPTGEVGDGVCVELYVDVVAVEASLLVVGLDDAHLAKAVVARAAPLEAPAS